MGQPPPETVRTPQGYGSSVLPQRHRGTEASTQRPRKDTTRVDGTQISQIGTDSTDYGLKKICAICVNLRNLCDGGDPARVTTSPGNGSDPVWGTARMGERRLRPEKKSV